ncbi:hypothetical protein N8K70_03995 [Microbacterium betulae]|uniref:Uncharacterized protein n=1 Tax=Microbacterium betulae TaxID=2981139 RepID=A0AA97FJE7_9MICO|nr:hypothetical protein [Microbacterium sp. AB]WOF23853.1 hypothetical protein N8K70_03995 [Microbacterium sp. AB]
MSIPRVQLPQLPAATSEEEADANGREHERIIREALAGADQVIVVYPDGSDDIAHLVGDVLVVEGYEDEAG